MIADQVELRVYDRDGVTLRDTIDATGLSWLDELGGVGFASFSAPLIQAAVTAHPHLLEDGIAKIAINLAAGEDPTEVFGCLTDPGSGTLVGANEDADKQAAPVCRGLLALLDDWVVHQEGGVSRQAADSRNFGWMSTAGAWYDSSLWITPPDSIVWSAVTSAQRKQQPKGWPDPDAEWIYGPNEFNLFRSTFTLVADTLVRVYASADELLNVYVDSQLVISQSNNEIGYTYLSSIDLLLLAGTHTIAVECTQEDSPLGDGVDAVICSVYALDGHGRPGTLIRHTNTTDWVFHSVATGGTMPGWTAADILIALITEAQARGIQSASAYTASFTAGPSGVDSDGNAWTDLQDVSLPVGTKGTEVIGQLVEVAYDLDLRPDMTLHAYIEQGSDLSATVALTIGVNILTYTWQGQPITATRVLMRTKDGWAEYIDTAAEAVTDRREGFIQSGQANSATQGRTIALAALQNLAQVHYSYTADVIAVAGCVPYRDFNKGDTINGYNHVGERIPVTVVSIAGAIPSEGGPVIWTLELEETGS